MQTVADARMATPAVSKTQPRERIVLSIEGNIGIGKSTLLSHLKARWKDDDSVAFVDEPVDLWEHHGLLEAMYTGRISRSAFQLMALTSRFGSLMKALSTDATLIITERSCQSDKAGFAVVNLDRKCDQDAYQATYDALFASLPSDVRHGMVLLHAPLPVLNERISKRGRAAEDADSDEGAGVPDEYLRRLDDAHRVFFEAYDPTVKRFVDATVSPTQVAQQVFIAIDEISEAARSACHSPTSVMML
jgi:deoxyadenosine/deoxycytidine kinase